MHKDEAFGVAHLAGMAAHGLVHLVEQTHHAVSQRTFTAVEKVAGPTSAPVRAAHDVTTRGVYFAVKGGLKAGSLLVGTLAAARATGTDSLHESPGTHLAISIANGFKGDLLEHLRHPLALGMSLRHSRADLEPDPDAIAASYPNATGRIVVFVHGLVENEDSWEYRSESTYGVPGVSYGMRLERDHGFTPLWVRFNSGLSIEHNGHALAHLLAETVSAWPVPVEDLVLVGHSMGGLLIRCALAEAVASGSPWVSHVTATVSLGTPVDGAPLERGVADLAELAERLAETRWVTELIGVRSVGIRDLAGKISPDLPDTLSIRQYAVAASYFDARLQHGLIERLRERVGGRLHARVGDGLVPVASALAGRADDGSHPQSEETTIVIHGIHHQDLLNDPQVYAQLVEWLTEPSAP